MKGDEEMDIKTHDGYEKLLEHLLQAYNQAAVGKGKERHANNLPFEQQEICQGNRELGSMDGAIFQARKKAKESKILLKLKGKEAAKAELYGAINYLCAACVLIDEIEP